MYFFFHFLNLDFHVFYHNEDCVETDTIKSALNQSHNLSSDYVDASKAFTNASTTPGYGDKSSTMYECSRENSLLFLLLMFGTLWVGVTIYRFTKR